MNKRIVILKGFIFIIMLTFSSSCVAWPAGISIAGAASGPGGSDKGIPPAFLLLMHSDSGSAQKDQPVALNQSPVASDVTVIMSQFESSRTISLNAVDPDGDSLSYTVVQNPQSGTVSISGSSAVYSQSIGDTPGHFKYAASDGKTASNAASANILRIVLEPVEMTLGQTYTASLKLIYPAESFAAGQTGLNGGTITLNSGKLTEDLDFSSVTWELPDDVSISSNQFTVGEGATAGIHDFKAALNIGGQPMQFTFKVTLTSP